jgi:hypothetical protein
MRWIWSGVLMVGMLLILWGVFEARQDVPSNPTVYGEDGTPVPPPPH